MNNKIKKNLMKSIIQNDALKTISILDEFDLELDESFFDYELLKAALVNQNEIIANFLLSKGCRVRNPSKTYLEETPLHLAMKLDDVSLISTILNNDAPLYDKNLQGDTPLHAAFEEKYYNAVNGVLDYISNSNLSFNPDNNDDILHFHIACIRKHINSVKLYLSLGFDVNSHLSLDSTEVSGLTPLQYLISKKDYGELFQILLEYSDLSIANSEGLTPLHSIYYNAIEKCFAYEAFYLDNFTNAIYQVFLHGNSTKLKNVVDKNGVSHFHLCCSTGFVDFVKVFIDNGADVNCSISLNGSRNPGYTPLHFAAKYVSIDVVELLLKNGADCNRQDKNGATPLHSASEIIESDGELKIIDLLLDYSASPIVADRFGNTPVHLTFNGILPYASEQTYILDKLISKIPHHVNLTDERGLSYFHIFCTRNYPDRINEYLNSGVAIDSVSDCLTDFSGYSALHLAVAFIQKDVVELLLKRNAQVNISSRYLDTPLHLACQYSLLTFFDVDCEHREKRKSNDKPISLDWSSNRTKQIDIIKLLLQYGADVEAKNFMQFTPLFSAFMLDNDVIDMWSPFCNEMITEINTRMIEITQILLSKKASIGSCETDQSIFHAISQYAFPKISDALMECLLTAGADINAVDKDGLTPLHVAVRLSKNELIPCFLKYKANVNVKCKKGRTPFELAVKVYKDYENPSFPNEQKLRKSSQSCVAILLKNSNDVNVNVRSSDGRSLLHVAVSASGTFLIQNLLNHGADINVEDSSGNSPVCSLLRNGEINNISISCIIFIHVQKLLALGLYVNDKVQNFCNYLHQYCKSLVSDNNYDSIWNVFDQCIDELKRMKMRKVDNYTTLYDILLKNSHDLSKHVRNRSLIKIIKSKDVGDATFQLYGYLLKVQYKIGLLRSSVLTDAKSSLISVTRSNLPDSCYDSILRYLTNEEIIILKAAAGEKLKRKLSDNNITDNTEPSVKIQKNE